MIMDDVQITIKKLIDELTEHKRRYYDLNEPIISDIEYDALHQLFVDYQKKYPEIVEEIGWKPFGKVVTHKHKMLSLESTQDLLVVLGTFIHHKWLISCEPKIDGLSLELVYNDKNLVSASTRGDGNEGEDVTANIRFVESIPKTISNDACIYGEIYLNRADFTNINKDRMARGKSLYTNLRNAAAGILRSSDTTRYLHLLQFFPYTVKDHNLDSQSSSFTWLKLNGFNTLDDYTLLAKYISDIEDYHDHMTEIREKLPFEIDGLVFKIDDFDLQEKIGMAFTHPKWAIAFKFKPDRVYTRLNDVVFQVGKSGIIAPVGLLNPVRIRGSLVGRASLSNESTIKKKDIRIGDIVALEMANDVIPYIAEPSMDDRTGKEEVIVFPKECPECHHPVSKNGVHYVCTNYQCPAQVIGKLINAVKREGFNIKGLGYETMNKLITHGLIKNIEDIFKLDDPEKISIMSQLNIGDKVIKNLINEIKRKVCIPIRKFIFALGIPNVSVATSAKLAEYFHDVKHLVKMQPYNSKAVLSNINSETIEAIEAFLRNSENIDMINRMVYYIRIEPDDTPTYSMNVAITGKFNRPRNEIKDQLNSKNINVTSKVNKSTSYLLCGENPSESKITTAKNLNIPIVGIDFF
jgi:DNA ligase (NAD+)